jgi:hypothetical protein
MFTTVNQTPSPSVLVHRGNQKTMEDVFDALTALAPFVMIIFVVWFGIRASMHQNRMRAELQKEVLAKFSTGPEVSAFLATDAGKQLMQEPIRSRWGSKGRVISLAVAGIIGVGAGLAFFIAGEEDAGPLFTGVGLALLASSVVSYWLAKKLGVSDNPMDSNSQ